MSRSFIVALRIACTTILLAAWSLHARAQMPTTLTLDAPRLLLQGDQLKVHATVTFPGGCPSAPTPTGGTVTLHTNSVGDITYPLGAGILRTCSGTSYSDATDFYVGSHAGDYSFTAEYSGTNGFAPAASTPIAVTVVPYLSGPVANGTAKLTVANRDSGFYCAAHSAAFDASTPPDAPAALGNVLGQVRYSFGGCGFECGFLCWPDAPRFPLETVTLEMPQPLPPDASIWVYAAGSGMTTPVWRHLPATIDGSSATFTVTANDGDSTLAGTLVIAPAADAARSDLQDLWWGGPAQNGWGFNVTQQGDRIFAGLYAYRGDGSPVWVVMSGGTWDASHTVFSGTLYGASGSSYRHYDPSLLRVAPSGSAKLTFAGNAAATLEYTIGTESGRKDLSRQPIGSSAQPVQSPYAGLWWGGSAQNGWGISLAQQDDILFAVWYTYDAAGTATWFVMPGSKRIGSPDVPSYTGTLYRTSGSPFLGAAYDPSKLVVTPVGWMGFTFYGSDVAYMSYSIDGQGGRQTLYRQPF